ncbi:MAG: hypothetical protein AB1750_15425 [Chloroflexota bacterium]
MFRTISRKRLLVAVVLLASLALTLPASAQSADPLPRLATTVPTAVFPSGTIPISRVVYIWTAVSGAAQYEYQVAQGGTVFWDQAADASVCVAGTCSVMPALDLANGSYAWRVRALIGGTYQAFSAWQAFTVSVPTEPAGFYSAFTSDAAGWVVHKGVWALESSNYYATPGVSGKVSSISHVNDYTTLTFEARMKRTGCTGCANTLNIRGNPVLDATGWWKTEYTFDYTNSGLFSVWRDYNGTYTALKNWTTTSAINKGGWNILKVTASGSSLKFYINDILVWSGADASYASGRVGIAMYRNTTSTGDKLYVDWAQLVTTVAAPDPTVLETIPEDQVEVPGGNRNMAP